jgi:capsular exopolysaccharide synthesis family protein
MEEINLKEFWDYYKRYIVLVILLTVLFASGMFCYSSFFKKPKYSTYTTVILVRENENQSSTTSDLNQDITLNQKLVSTYSEIVKSRLVLEQVIDDLDLDYSYASLSNNISVNSLDETEILKIVVTDKNAEDAVTIANKLTKVFGEEVSKIYKIDNVSVIDEAKLNDVPVNIHTIKDTIIGALIGFILSSGIVFVIFYFDDILRDPETLETSLNIPVLAKIFKDHEGVELIVNERPNAAATECIRNLRTSLQFSSIDEELKTILVTSSVPNDGKSFVSSNLAISFAQAGKKVLLIDCDLRKGRQHKIFDVDGHKGLSNLLIKDIGNHSDYIIKTNIKNLSLLPRGTFPPNPSELLNSKKNATLIGILKNKYDIVILDGAPVNGLSDSLILSSLVDKTILISSVNHTPKTELLSAKKALEGVGANLAGCVANNIVAKRGSYGGYYYYYGYSEKSSTEEKTA